MTAETDLLPCPFCGSDDIGESYVSTYSVDSSYDVFGCRSCDARFESGTADDWNRRACVSSATEALRAEVADARQNESIEYSLRIAAEARAERLAEALRLAEEHINVLTPEWYSTGQRVLAEIRAALEQENSDGREAGSA